MTKDRLLTLLEEMSLRDKWGGLPVESRISWRDYWLTAQVAKDMEREDARCRRKLKMLSSELDKLTSNACQAKVEDSFNAGMQKVIEWVNQEASLWDKHFPFTEVVRVMNEERWQAFCKELLGEENENQTDRTRR